MITNTLYRITSNILAICEDHLLIDYTAQGTLDQIDENVTFNGRTAWLIFQDSNLEEGAVFHNFNLILLDVEFPDRSNEKQIQSDMMQVAVDIIGKLNIVPLNKAWIDLTNVTITPFVERFNDYVSGVTVSFSVKALENFNVCSDTFAGSYVPTSDGQFILQPTQYLTCTTLNDCPSFIAVSASAAAGGGGGGSTPTGSLLVTASAAQNILTFTKGDGSTFDVTVATGSAPVTQLLAGPNITLSPTNGLGQVTISSTAGGGSSFNTATGSYGSFYDTTTQTNPVGNVPRSMSFNTTAITNGVSISGSTSPFNTYIKTENPGVYNLQFSAQLDKTDSGTDEIVIWLRKNGIDLIDTATSVSLVGNNAKNVAAWNFFVNSAANDYYQIIWYSPDTSVRLFAEPAGGGHPGIPSEIATVDRVDQFLSNTGSFSGSFTGNFTGSFTGSLQGTASNAVSANTASFITPVNAGLAGLPYTVFNSSAASAIATTVDFTINTSQLRNGSTVILQGYMSRASGAGTVTFSWTANSNANTALQSFTSTTQYGIQFYWTAKYISGTNSLRFFRTPTTSFQNNTSNATTFFDVAAIGGVFTINFRATVTAGSATGATENLTCQIIY